MFNLESPKVVSKFENVTVTEGNDANFVIRFTGKPKPLVKWFREEIEIITTSSEYYELVESEESITFIIKRVKADYSGSFFAEITNEVGTVKTNKIQLIVNS